MAFKPGDGLLLARLYIEWSEQLVHDCAIDFLNQHLSNAKFLLAELMHYCNAVAQGQVPDNVTDAYSKDFI